MDMVLAVVGDRHYSNYKEFSKVLKDELERYPANKLVTGDATGVDTMALQYATINIMPITVYCADRFTYERLLGEGVDALMVADWQIQGKSAGPIRNTHLLREAGKVLLFSGGGPGSRNVLKQAEYLKKEVEEWKITVGSSAG